MSNIVTLESGWKSRTEPVINAIRDHEIATTDWAFRDGATRLNRLFDGLNLRFFAGKLPKAVISLGPDLILRYGYYRIGRDEIGALHRIHLNTRHFGRSESDVAVTLLHEMIHMHQLLHGTPSHRHRYHNREFVDMAEAVGIEAKLGNGTTLGVMSRLRHKLMVEGFSEAMAMIPGADDSAIQRPVRKRMWRCGCEQEIWAFRNITVHAVCSLCDQPFDRPNTKGDAE